MKQFAKIAFVIWLIVAFTMPTFAHGVRISHSIDARTGEITVTAEFDTGEVLDEAAVIIFAPDDLVNPWDTGTMDDSGSFTFTPDYEIEGFWDIQVRKAGHGGIVNVEITEDMMPALEAEATAETTDATTLTLNDGSEIVIRGEAQVQVDGDVIVISSSNADTLPQLDTPQPTDATSNGFTSAQIAIMSASVIWGCIGTALYFSRRKSAEEKSK